MKLWNFAISGSVVTLELGLNFRRKFKDLFYQYNLFYERMSQGKKYFNQWNSNNTLFSIYMGSNDIKDINFINNNRTINENINYIVDIIFNKIECVKEIGGNNFLVINIPPFELAPINSKNKYNYFKDEIFYFNNLLNKKAEELYIKYKDINIIIYNINNEYKYIMKNYKKYNFISCNDAWKLSENKVFSKLDQYFWRDNTHISNKANRIIAEDINELLISLNKN
ncbi:hypothetical protein LY90DRAFT_509184 [Neocallimastix californiae]|uniref:SGNH hydrolase n=1 Tax=Neocallimastix californiae TaxID=1754190 RepID=A0A1Y2CI61_9FUNG|nr:hypothetical protein LY90DRAFT_509184 [Neocallimastix californiae]|eukprot:ORY46733.1 hypothetical protein LY90DRAFT_509184 [Neocallimastix californiae]